MNAAHRETIFVEDATVLMHQEWPDQQYILRLQAEQCARNARPGQFIHLKCDDSLPLRRPLSIMQSDARAGWIDLLYKIVGQGTMLLARQQIAGKLNLIGPIGNTFEINASRPHRLLIGGGVGIPPMIFLANHIASVDPNNTNKTLLLMGSESPFPFELATSKMQVSGTSPGCDFSLPEIEQLEIPSRLASLQKQAGIYQGYVTDLARQYITSLDSDALPEMEIFSCGPTPMLHAVKQLAAEFNLPCQISLEEYMACAVGGCAGCVVQLTTAEGNTMKRVCVDGPVFNATTVNF